MQQVVKASRLYPQSGSSSFTITGSETQSVFQIPPDPFYLDKSILRFTATIDEENANTTHCYAYVGNLPMIRRIELYTSSKQLEDINDVNFLTAITHRAMSSLEYLKTRPMVGDGIGFTNGLAKIGCGAVIAAKSAPFTPAHKYQPARPLATAAALSSSDQDPNGTLYLVSGPNGNGNSAGDLDVIWRINLGIIYDSIFASKELQYFGENVYLRITWASRNYFGYEGGDDATYPDSGAVALGGTGVLISSLSLEVAQERNLSLVDAVKVEAMSPTGRTVYFTSMRHLGTLAGGAAGTHNVQIRLPAQLYGMTCKRLLFAPFSSTESLTTQFEHSNVSQAAVPGARITSYYSSMDGNRIQSTDISAADYDDVLLHRSLVEGSALLNEDCYLYNWFHCEDFTGKNKPLWKAAAEDNADVSGLVLDQEHLWSITAAAAVATNNYRVWGAFSRKYTIANNVMV